MKKLYFLTIGLFSIFATAQQTISFETSEAYNLGNVNGQNGWEITLNSGNQPINNQTISNENASEGTQSLKIDVDENENFGWFPIFGASKQLTSDFNYVNLNVEFDVFISELDGSTFEFGTWGVSGDEFVPISVYSFNYTGNLEIVNSVDYDYETSGFTWEANKWYKLKAEITENDIKYYVDGNLVYTGQNFAKVNVAGVNFLHDNFGGHAFIDNIKLNNETLAASDFQKEKLNIYPNPVKNNLNFSLPNAEKIAKIKITNIAGQTVLNKEISQNTMNLENLKPGVYLVTITNTKGISYSSKFIKD